MDTRELIRANRSIIYIFLQKEPSFICLDNSEIPPERSELMVLKRNLFYYKKKIYWHISESYNKSRHTIKCGIYLPDLSAQKPSFLELEISSIQLKKAVTFWECGCVVQTSPSKYSVRFLKLSNYNYLWHFIGLLCFHKYRTIFLKNKIRNNYFKRIHGVYWHNVKFSNLPPLFWIQHQKYLTVTKC